MGTELPDNAADELAKIASLVTSVGRILGHAGNSVEAWLEANGAQRYGLKWSVIAEHVKRLTAGSSALADRIADLGKPHRCWIFATAFEADFCEGAEVVETEDAYDTKRLRTLCVRDIADAIEFGTERKNMLGVATMDEELETPLTNALSEFLDHLEEGSSSIPGYVAQALKTFIKGHRRGFGRYYSGIDPWPRSPAIIQAEIDRRMPDALRWLEYELKEALEQESEQGDRDEQ